MKDNKKRGNKNKGFQWLLVMDKSNFDCYLVMDLFLPLVNKSVDKIFGLTLMPHFVQNDDDVKKKFYEKMAELNFKEGEQFEYLAKQYKDNPSSILVEFVNHNNEQFFDFVIFLNNPMKFKSQKQDCDTFKYVKSLYANIGFCNYAHIYGYDYKVLSKLPNEIDPRKYLDKIKKPDATELMDALNLEYPNRKEDKKEVKVEKEAKKNENVINDNKDKEKENEEIYSEVYGVKEGNVFEKTSDTNSKNNNQKNDTKTVNIKRDNKKKKTWAPGSIKKNLGGEIKCAVDASKKSSKDNNKTNKTKKTTGKK